MPEDDFLPSVQNDMDRAAQLFEECLKLMKQRNAKYGNSWKVLTIQSIANLIEMKMHRIANMNAQDLDPKVEDEFMDVANYSIFGLMKIIEILQKSITAEDHQ